MTSEHVLIVGAPRDVAEETRAALAPDFLIEQASDAQAACVELTAKDRPAAVLLWAHPPRSAQALARACAASAVPLLLLVEERTDEATLLASGACDYLTRPLQHIVARARLRAQLALFEAAPAARAEPVLALYAMRDRLRTMARQLARDADSQYRHISSSLHDETAQDLAAACMYLSASLKNGSGADDALLGKATELVHKTLADLRALMVDISPPHLRDQGLRAALDWLAERHGRRGGRPCRFEVDAALVPLDDAPMSAAMQIARMVLDSLGGGGEDAQIDVRVDGDERRAVFDVRETSAAADGRAQVRELCQSAAALGARVQVESECPARLRIEVTLV